MSRTIRLGFAGFDSRFDPEHNYFTDLLREDYAVKIVAQPTFLIYSARGGPAPPGSQFRILYSDLPRRPHRDRFRLDECDWAFTWVHDDARRPHPRHLRLPPYALWQAPGPAAEVSPDPVPRKAFCAVLEKPANHHHHNLLTGVARLGAMTRLSPPITVESLRRFQFVLVTEETCRPGFTSQKLSLAFESGAIPIYWGNPALARDFNPEAVVHYQRWNKLDPLLEQIRELHEDPEALEQCASAPRKLPGHTTLRGFRERVRERFRDVLGITDRQLPTLDEVIAFQSGKKARGFFQ